MVECLTPPDRKFGGVCADGCEESTKNIQSHVGLTSFKKVTSIPWSMLGHVVRVRAVRLCVEHKNSGQGVSKEPAHVYLNMKRSPLDSHGARSKHRRVIESSDGDDIMIGEVQVNQEIEQVLGQTSHY